MTDPCFITVEGIEGAGKTTCLNLIEQRVRQRGHPVLVTREPGGTALGEARRTLLLGHRHEGRADDTALLWMFAARAEHLHKVIIPALNAGTNVLCDRFTEATYAYQGGGRELGMEKIADLENWVQGDLRPDLTVVLDAPVDIGRERAGKRSAPDRIEKEKNDFFDKVRNTYLEQAKQHPERIAVVDASVELEQVQQQIYDVLLNYRIIE